MDVFSGLGCIDFDGHPCRKCGAETHRILQAALALGWAFVCLCMASDVVSRLRDGNSFACLHCIHCALCVDEWLASVFDLGLSCGSKYLGPSRRFELAWSNTYGRVPD